MNSEPAVPDAVKALVIAGGGGRMRIGSVSELVPPALMALMVAPKVPVPIGVPEISPVEALTPKPGGSPVAPKLVG